MKKIRYSTGLKATMVVVQQIFFVVLVVSILLVTTLFRKNILDFGDIKNKSFSTSAYFSSLFQQSAEEIFNFVELRKKFETDGNYDTEKQIDIQKYYSSQGRVADGPEDKTVDDDSDTRRYYLGDLVEWARNYTYSQYNFQSSYYIDDEIHQKQTVTREGKSVYNEEKIIGSLGDMSLELQELIVANVEHYYGGSYQIPGVETTTDGEVTVTLTETAGDEEAIDEGGVDEELLQSVIQRVIEGGLYDLNSEELIVLLKDMGMQQKVTFLWMKEAFGVTIFRGIVQKLKCKNHMRH